jgi:carboxypeptidase PM20D1
VSSTESAAWETLVATVGEIFPDAVPAPALVLGGTDSKHYGLLAENAYRFAPLQLRVADTERLHGVNERIAVENYRAVIDFYAALLRRTAGPEAPAGVPAAREARLARPGDRAIIRR